MNIVMKNRIIGLVAAAALLTACGKSEGGVDNPSEVTFTTEITRAADVQSAFENGAQMNVWLSKTNAGVDMDAAFYSAVCTGGLWKGSPKAITLETTELRYLYAIYPYNAAGSDASHYPVSVRTQTDVLYSGSGVAVSRSKNSVKLTLKHAMAIFAFDVQSLVGGTLQQVEIGGAGFATEGELRITNGKITATATGSYTQTCNETLSGRASTSERVSFFVIPFSSLENVEVKLKIDGTEYACKLPAADFESNHKYELHFCRTETGVSLLGIDAVALDEMSAGFTAGSYGQVGITQYGASFTLPTVTGPSTLYGTVYWGDEQSESYAAGRTHTYAADAEHRVTLDLWGASTVAFESLEGVGEIDFSKF